MKHVRWGLSFFSGLLLTQLALGVLWAGPFPEDGDRDGLDDSFEQEILERFRPSLQLSEGECDGLPSAFRPEVSEPEPLAADGTLYGQVFPVAPPGASGAFIEVHYFHLWANDCGPFGHRLDTEYISGLLYSESFASSADGWKALYWFAAAHEGTLCDMSNAAPAEALGGVDRGPRVWVSRGKHASFLDREICERVGCGGDRCEASFTMTPGPLVNLGEASFPLNGAIWSQSSRWALAGKMASDFDDSRHLRFEGLEEAKVVDGFPPPTRSLLLAGNKTIGALQTHNEQTGKALGLAGSHTAGAVAKSLKASGRALQRFAGWLLGGGREGQER